MALYDKKLYLMQLISQEQCIMWSSFMVHVSKDKISRHFLYFFQILIFRVISGVKGWKMAQNEKKTILRKHTLYDRDFWYTRVKWWHFQMLFLTPNLRNCTSCVKWWYLQQFFSLLQNSIFLGFYGRCKREENYPYLPVSVCHTLYLRNCRSYHQDFWYVDVK